MPAGFLSGLGRLAISVGTSYFGSRLAEKRQLGNIKASAFGGNGRVPEPGGGFRRPPGALPAGGPGTGTGVFGPGSTVPAWHEAVHAGGRKRRRMDFGNTRALTRALRRAEGFTRLVKRTNKAIRRIAR